MISKYCTLGTIQIMSPNLQCEHYDPKFKIMGGVVDFVGFELPRSIGDDLSSLHEYVSQPWFEASQYTTKSFVLFERDMIEALHNDCFNI